MNGLTAYSSYLKKIIKEYGLDKELHSKLATYFIY